MYMFWTRACRHTLYHSYTCYTCLPDDEPCGLQLVHVEDIVKIKLSLTKVHFIGLHYMIMEYGIEGVVVCVRATQAEKSG